MLYRCLGDEQKAENVDVELLVEVLCCNGFNGCELEDAGVVD